MRKEERHNGRNETVETGKEVYSGKSGKIVYTIDEYITPFLLSTDEPNFAPLANAIGRVAVFYVIGVVSVYLYNRIMVKVTQGTLRSLRNELFAHMEKLPIKYFDTYAHGDIMSIYTNDIDTLRQMISQSIPQVINSGFTIVSVFVSMVILNIPLTIVTLLMVGVMLYCTKSAAGQSGKYFLEQQKNLGAVNGFIEEMMDGQKVVKVFCHEEETKKDFKELNEKLFVSTDRAHTYSNYLGPINAQLGNISYVICVIVMAMAGAERIFKLLDEKPEVDEGYVTLVNVEEENGALKESEKRTGRWAWKHVHQADVRWIM